MFGSKLRSWMENHIVRPRKKGNKNKNGTSNNLATANGAQNGHKGTGYTIYQGDTTTATSAGTTNSISSPARRSEVSPIQSHTTSRFGWQSPKQETAMSPKSDHFLYVHTVKAHTLSSSSSLTTAATAIDSSSSHSSAIAKKTKTLSPNNMLRKSSFSFMQDSNNTSSQKQQCPPNSNNKQQQQFSHNHQSQVHASHKKIPTNSAYHAPVTYASTNQKQHEINLQNNNKSQSSNKQTIPKQTPPPPPQGKKVDSRYQNGGVQHFDESRYGKILPSKRGSVESFSPSLGSYDSLNANIHFQSTQDEKVLPSNNNNGNLGSNSTPAAPKTNCIANGPAAYHQPPHIHHHHHHTPSQMPPRNGYEGSRNLLRTNRYNGNSMLGPPSNHPLAHVINSLSSPESAYSTGYSTDGTSPGATYTPPEYYINMRTGTHYFPKGVNTLAIEATRYKFGLNKIEEMSPQEPLPNNHRRTESFDLGQNKIPGFGIPDPSFFQAKSVQCQSPVPQASIVIPSYKGFESPSPRQRCRIRTNPWYSTTDTSSSGNSTFLAKKIEVDASSSSSGIKSSSDAGASDKNEKNEQSSDTETTSSSTEVEAVQRTFSPGTIRRRKAPTEASKSEPHVTQSLHQDSDEDATLNEMMGKFDESYVYEKETDILSDSDPTDCVSDLDTGQDAGDECDTDDLLDIDFIDNGSIQEIVEKEAYKNTGSCSYFNYQLDRRASRMRRSRKQNEDHHTTKRKKRLMKTRKKSVENKDKNSPIRKSRESRSLGGTPVCLRRNQSADNNKKTSKISPLTNRSNSLTFTEVHAIRGRFVAIAESEKALLKADLEADVKYKQLIHEAETILVSMKTCALRETPVASPRRICNPPPNKRVEMLRNYEADIKREASKQAKPVETHEIVNAPASVDGILVNKRLEMLRYETNSAPNSPKSSRFSPRKTHITNFINQNAPPAELVRRNSIPDSPPPVPKSPQLQLNGRVMRSPISSPSGKRRVRSQSPRISLYSDSDSEEEHSRKSVQHRRGSFNKSESEANTTTKNNLNDTLSRKSRQTARSIKEDLNNRNIVIETEKITVYDQSDITNRNIIETKKPSLMSFRSIDMGNRTSVNGYCPQSEPLKRKIYKGSSSFERIKKSLDLESEIPKQAILEKISNLRKERQSVKNSNSDINNTTNSQQDPKTDDDNSYSSNVSTKHQLILNTIEDLKRSLEDQSVELCGLNDDAQ